LGALAAFLFLRPGWEATNLNQFLFVLDCFFGGGAMNPIRSIAFLAGAGLLAVCLSASAQTATQPTRAAAEKDPVLKAMLEELDRSKSQLQLQGLEKPFFIQYRIEDVDDFTTRSAFGASVHSQRSHQRIAFITVRVGDNKTDSSSGRNDGALAMVNLDDDPIAIRSALWEGTDQAYKAALKAYAQKQAALKQVETPPQADDFSREKPLISLAAPLSLNLDEQAWTERVARDSGLYRTNASVKDGQRDVQYSFAQFSARVTTTWLATSEGAIVRKPAARYEESFEVGTQAADGMRLERSYSTTGNSLQDLDSPRGLRSARRRADRFADRPAQGAGRRRGVSRAGAAERRCEHRYRSQSAAGAVTATRPRWAPRRAPMAPLPPAITRVCCRSFWTWWTIPA
jgi:hypothetical protein